MEERAAAAAAAADVEIERTKLRCRAVIDRIHTLFPPNLKKKPSSSSSRGCYETLVRLAHAELSFLSRSNSDFISLSSNIGHIEAVLHILQQPFVKGVSRVCQPIPLSGLFEEGQKCTSKIHIDIVCTLNGKPVWFLVSARNPKYVFWDGPCGGQNKSLRTRILQVINAAARSSVATKPSSIILFFSNGLNESVRLKLEVEFEASKFELDLTDFDILSEELESDWVYVISKSYRQACVYEIKVDCSSNTIGNDDCEDKDSLVSARRTGQAHLEESIVLKLGSSFCQLVSRMKLPKLNVEGSEFDRLKDLSGEADLINFDTTALIAIVSGISNGCAKELLAKSEGELRRRFKGNVGFVIAQVMSEIQSPIHADLDGVLSGKKGIICESVVSEFKQLVSMCGGPHEKSRADHLLKYLVVVPDIPSTRMMSLPTTRKLALKNKVVFGTGDYARAPTLTANMAFARAVSQTGMSLFTIEHRPRALTGD